MRRVLLIASKTGYQTRAFGEAAERAGVELVFATDRCKQLDNPWRDGAIPVRFHDEAAFLEAIGAVARQRPFDGVLGVGDRPALFAALAADALGLRGHPPPAARLSGNKLETRRCLASAGLPCPVFHDVALDGAVDAAIGGIDFPCVVKPLVLSGSRGVIRADDPDTLRAAVERVRRLLTRGDLRARRDSADTRVVVETFIPGREYAVEGLVEDGVFRVLALFDKPDPLDGPFFEETIYVTPSAEPDVTRRRIEQGVGDAVRALGLRQGPVHAECRVNDKGVFVLEVAPRPIGGLCARALRFAGPHGSVLSLEELLLRHALGESANDYRRETAASAVMMIPIPRAGTYRRTDGVAEAGAVPGIVNVVMTAKRDQRMEPPPEGASYLGFIFARANDPGAAVEAVRQAHAQLGIVIDPLIPVV
ncbi:MAG: ATP-grasp domain-containing protein [Vicinamibacterales bacterium]|jgi:biotin carboxylase|nr:ATP-grasp domain-containing protein [Vicinamibacterales bacterium]